MRVSVAVALPGCQEVVEVELPPGATVEQALRAARVAERHPGLDLASLEVGIWSRRSSRDAALREGDRVEVYRPLQADAKALRRERAQRAPLPRAGRRPPR